MTVFCRARWSVLPGRRVLSLDEEPRERYVDEAVVALVFLRRPPTIDQRDGSTDDLTSWVAGTS